MKKYKIIYADPPWSFGSKAYQDGQRDMLNLAKTQYQTMSHTDLKELPVYQITEENAALFLWTTDAHLKEAIEVMETWGFSYKTVAFNWIKRYKTGSLVYNFAPWTLKSHELCLLGIKGKMGHLKKSNNVKGLIEAERTTHSKKPHEARFRIEALFGNLPRIELFAREKTPGWDVWGNEVESDIIL